jgi:hypothetical protein
VELPHVELEGVEELPAEVVHAPPLEAGHMPQDDRRNGFAFSAGDEDVGPPLTIAFVVAGWVSWQWLGLYSKWGLRLRLGAVL